MRTLRAIDLFTGAGGLTLGFHKAMEDLGIDFEVVASVELDKDSAKTYAKNFSPDNQYVGDIGVWVQSNEIPEAEVIGTAENEVAYWKLIKQQLPDLVLLDLGLGGSTTVGVEICRQTKELHPNVKVLIFTGEILNEKLWVDVLDAGADGICLKSGELLTRSDVASVISGKRMVFNQPILEKIVGRFKQSVNSLLMHQEAMVSYEIDEYDERFLRHLALGYTKEQITNLRGMPFGVKSLEKRQNELVQKLFPGGNNGMSVNATRLVVRALELRIIDIDNLHSDEE